ncbi:PaaX family transcriptional regulator [Amycolatopsis acidicola]|uniref:PaaX family transcriptional regulator n=1 Tax=Amycolatopsis acidicola TaxID=2596893 RepID=A0A5N0UVT8_9PSEU|nr:PaaX family transcriptional regulator C-terminal domain-containing protein [Amycolatopsis acidicola]KAA9156684.1 PaaX family transcriptional regulator [Amycolatopsis acidicola]
MGVPDVSMPRLRKGPEPQRLLTGLLGDYWFWRDEHIPSKVLVRLLAEFGITEESARAALRRLAARKLVTASREGRTTAYGIPQRTAEVIVDRSYRMLAFGESAPDWDGRWTVVAFSVPEGARGARSSLRTRLRVLRFGPLYDGVWVSPHDQVKPVLDVLEELGVRGSVLRAEEAPGGPEDGLLLRAFDIEALAGEYRSFLQRHRKLADRAARGRVGPAEALVVRATIGAEWRRFPDLDPDLPAALLPPGWPRPEARELFLRIYDTLGPLGEHHFRTILREGAPELADLAAHHTFATIERLYREGRHAHGDTDFERAARERQAAELGERK